MRLWPAAVAMSGAPCLWQLSLRVTACLCDVSTAAPVTSKEVRLCLEMEMPRVLCKRGNLGESSSESDSEDSLEDVRESGRNVRRRIENEDPSER